MKTITKSQRLQLVGLLALADFHMDAVEKIAEAAHEITGEQEGGYTMDAIYDDNRRNADALLKRLKITVRGK